MWWHDTAQTNFHLHSSLTMSGLRVAKPGSRLTVFEQELFHASSKGCATNLPLPSACKLLVADTADAFSTKPSCGRHRRHF